MTFEGHEHTPEAIERLREARRRYCATPAGKAQLQAAARARWSRPGAREEHAAAQRQRMLDRYADMGERERKSATMAASWERRRRFQARQHDLEGEEQEQSA